MLLSEAQKTCAEEAIRRINSLLLLECTSYDPSVKFDSKLEELLQYFEAVVRHYKKD